MKKNRWLLVAALMLLLVPSAVAAEDEEYEPPEDKDKIKFATGYRATDTDGALFRVAEYTVTDSTPVLGLLWSTSRYDENLVDFWVKRISEADWDTKAAFEMDRKVRLKMEGTGLLHRLGHDSLDNLNAVSEIKTVRSTDLDPTAAYGINYSNMKIGAEFQHPDVSWLSWNLGVRQQKREGTRQQLASGHCSSCHVTSQGREVDQTTQDFVFGAHATTGGVDVDYEFLGRDFQDKAPTVQSFYEIAYRPATPVTIPDYENVLVQPFNDRLWFQAGDYAVNQVPQLRKSQHTLKARGKLNDKNVLNVTLVRSDTKNRTTDLDYEITGFRGRYTWRPKDSLRLNLYGHWDQLQSSSYYVDMQQIFGPAPTQGYPGGIGVTTFQDFYNNNVLPTRPADWVVGQQNFYTWDRLSTMDRQKSKLGFDLYFRPGRAHNLRFGYFYQDIDRDYVTLADGSGKTTSHNLKLTYNYRASKKLRWYNRLSFKTVDNPHVNVDGGLRYWSENPDGFSPGPPAGPGPRGPASFQYFEMQAFRVGNLGADPTQLFNVRSQITWRPGSHWSLSGNVRYRDAETDDLDYTEWNQNTMGVGLNFWFAANAKFHFTVGLDSQKQETDTWFIVPVFDG